ncbi:heme A synthase [Bacillaceae bacterium SIJ1]|uniref:COX15/CtaA family protein n=1 Tax=Litoribacterium kuwaitense TaxID=1398745 RepID=UPI0013EE1B73|nr:heme A synthase [Litoribacterium kuwaitense]NGP44379.1 heme A synthase [Litoribacterium kuwaitense]
MNFKEGDELQRLMRWLGVFSIFCMLLVLLGGALVTKTDSGAGCGTTWPLCHGEFLPQDLSKDTLIEWSHRGISAYTGIIIGIFSIWTAVHFRKKEVYWLSALSLFFLILQALIGAGAVVWGQSDVILALHFGISLISFASVVLLTINVFERTSSKNPSHTRSTFIPINLRKEFVWMIVYLYIVVYSGAYVRHMGASLVCPGLPFCAEDSGAVPQNVFQWVHMGHRTLASLIFVWLLILLIRVWRNKTLDPFVQRLITLCFIFVTLQALTGMLVVITMMSLVISLLHALFVSCLFAVLSYLILLSIRNYQSETSTK